MGVSGPAVASPVVLGPTDLAAGRPGLVVLNLASTPAINGPVLPGVTWRLSVSGQMLTAVGAPALDGLAGPSEAGQLTSHGGIYQDQPGGG